MIRNPWPLNWKAPQRVEKKDWSGTPCPHDFRHTLFCSRMRRGNPCHDCYMRQQSMSFLQMTRERIYIDRICDRCGGEISNPDSALYFSLEGRKGEQIVNFEICRDCAAELADWLNGMSLPRGEDISSDQMDDSMWD